MTRYEAVAYELEQRRPALEFHLAQLVRTLGAALRETLPRARPTVSGRVKSAPAVWLKMERFKVPCERVDDLLAVRVVVEGFEDCYGAADTVRALWQGRSVRTHDYIASPKADGYQSLHVCVADPAWPPFEVQIRTREMDRAWGDGAVSHDRYKASLWRTFLNHWAGVVAREPGTPAEA